MRAPRLAIAARSWILAAACLSACATGRPPRTGREGVGWRAPCRQAPTRTLAWLVSEVMAKGTDEVEDWRELKAPATVKRLAVPGNLTSDRTTYFAEVLVRKDGAGGRLQPTGLVISTLSNGPMRDRTEEARSWYLLSDLEGRLQRATFMRGPADAEERGLAGPDRLQIYIKDPADPDALSQLQRAYAAFCVRPPGP